MRYSELGDDRPIARCWAWGGSVNPDVEDVQLGD
jgi:hypothetical protein